jgi:dipeptidyl aminopeptidase/acylaminoacyl peptidase
LVFSAVSPFTPVPTVTPLPRRAAGWVDTAEAAVERHGLPMDLFAVGTDGTGLTRLTTVGEDSPQATWSPDGKRIAIVSGGGTYVLPVGTVELQLVDPEGGHGAIDWR